MGRLARIESLREDPNRLFEADANNEFGPNPYRVIQAPVETPLKHTPTTVNKSWRRRFIDLLTLRPQRLEKATQ